MAYKANFKDWRLWLHYGIITAVLLVAMPMYASMEHNTVIAISFGLLVLSDQLAHMLLNFD